MFMAGNMSTGMRDQAGDADHGDDQADHHDEVGIANRKAGHLSEPPARRKSSLR